MELPLGKTFSAAINWVVFLRFDLQINQTNYFSLLPDRWLFLAAFIGAILIGVTLFARGQPLICKCGYVQFWVGSVFSSENSQHIANWYTLSHIVHGMLIVLAGRLIAPKWNFRTLVAIAIVTGVAWEIIEHTDWVLN